MKDTLTDQIKKYMQCKSQFTEEKTFARRFKQHIAQSLPDEEAFASMFKHKFQR